MGGGGEGDPGFFLGWGAPLRNGVINWCGKQILKANTTEKKASSQEGGVHIPLHPPARSTLADVI